MIKKIILVIGVLILIFIGYVSTRPGHFSYERSGLINAPPEKIFPYLRNFKRGQEWSPYEKVDPNMKRNFKGTDGQVGSIMEFQGNRDAGSGSLEILRLVENELVEIRLIMTEPVHADNIITYKLTTEGDATRFSWSMSGDGGFVGKLISVLIDCEKMIADQMIAGITNLKNVVESQK
jgi:uncharacterized protein YndB with AHSA1/START domain